MHVCLYVCNILAPLPFSPLPSPPLAPMDDDRPCYIFFYQTIDFFYRRMFLQTLTVQSMINNTQIIN